MNPYGMSPTAPPRHTQFIPENSNFLMGTMTPILQRITKNLLLLLLFPYMFFCLFDYGKDLKSLPAQ